MTIRNMAQFVNSIWDWAILDGCFGNTRIKPTDIDGMVERRGHFLLLEGKGLGVPIPQAQEIMFNKLRQTGNFTIIVIWGTPNEVSRMQVRTPTEVGDCKAATSQDLRSRVREWFEMADSTSF